MIALNMFAPQQRKYEEVADANECAFDERLALISNTVGGLGPPDMCFVEKQEEVSSN